MSKDIFVALTSMSVLDNETFLIIVGLASSVPDESCRRLSNSDCETCLKESGCAFCQNNKQCFAYDLYPTHPPCSTSDLKFKTCFGKVIEK